jgi:8-oxo-dGTP pyrophosphatase MutT (NUDIX family)
MTLAGWSPLQAARERRLPRAPLFVDGREVGAVARGHLPVLAAWPQWLHVADGAVTLLAPRPERDDALAVMNHALRAQGLVQAWRDEAFALFDPATGEELATMERAATRFWGTLTLGAHATGFVRDGDGRVARLWIAQRSPHKATDPGLFDNLVGGGVPAGQGAHEALLREGFEEAGLDRAEMAAARPAGVLRLHRDIPEGLQHEFLHAFDLELPPGRVPVNQDGEVAGFTPMRPDEARACALSGAMTVDAALVTLDFLLRHDLLPHADGPDGAGAVAAALAALRVPPAGEGR